MSSSSGSASVDPQLNISNGRWRDVLSEEGIKKYEFLALEKLGPEYAHWLTTGEIPARRE